MKTVFKTSMLVAALSLGVVACEGPKENAMEDTGEAQAEATNDAAEAAADAGQITDAQADNITDKAEDKADAMEKQGEAMDAGATPTATTTPM